jgi:hypothetical protein
VNLLAVKGMVQGETPERLRSFGLGRGHQTCPWKRAVDTRCTLTSLPLLKDPLDIVIIAMAITYPFELDWVGFPSPPASLALIPPSDLPLLFTLKRSPHRNPLVTATATDNNP